MSTTDRDREVIAKIRELLGEVNKLVPELSSHIHIKFDVLERTVVTKQYPTSHLYLRAEERTRL